MAMVITKYDQKQILADARDMISNGKTPAVIPLMRRHFIEITKSNRRVVSKLLDDAGIERRRCRRDGVKKATSPSDFGQKYEALSQVFVSISAANDVDLYLVERAKAGNARAMQILKKLVDCISCDARS
jgi:hypothetical protein